jgi:hypothetical protein
MQAVRPQLHQPNWNCRPTPATGTFLTQWPLDLVSGRSQISPSNTDFGGSSRFRINTSGYGELQLNGRISSRR